MRLGRKKRENESEKHIGSQTDGLAQWAKAQQPRSGRDVAWQKAIARWEMDANYMQMMQEMKSAVDAGQPCQGGKKCCVCVWSRGRVVFLISRFGDA